MAMDKLIIKGAREHNLKNIDLELPREKLIVISGLSGSGKSSLAFDTIFAEGQRRYVESLSSYARMFLGLMNKPDIDYIEGLSPAISIEQKTTHRNPRSTVGTVTEIHDYLRLLYARIGVPHCPKCGKVIREQSVDQILDTILSWPQGTKIQILAPVIRGKKGEHVKILEDAKAAGFVRARVDGVISLLEEEIKLDKQKKHSIDIVIDRLKVSEDTRKRIAESIETALSTTEGNVVVLRETAEGEREEFFSQHNSCPDCGISLPKMEPRLFSFNSPFGACPDCTGLGSSLNFEPDLIVPDPSLSFEEGALVPYNPEGAWNRSRFESLAKHFKFKLSTPYQDYPKSVKDIIFYGTDEQVDFHYTNREGTGYFDYNSKWGGIIKDLNKRYLESSSQGVKDWLEQFMSQKTCPTCAGKRYRPEALAVTVGGKNLFDVSNMTVGDALDFFKKLSLSETEKIISKQILKEVVARLGFLVNVGLEYLSLERSAGTLSGGEAQRIRLATQIGSSLMGVLYILDEPSIGLHQRDNHKRGGA
jgi:excinuclease ABC subunit A